MYIYKAIALFVMPFQQIACSRDTFCRPPFTCPQTLIMVFKGQDAWRKHPLLSDCHRKPFPAFGIALKIFAVYLVVDCYVKHITGKFHNLHHFFTLVQSTNGSFRCVSFLLPAPPPSQYKPSVKYYWGADGSPLPRLSKSHDDHH